MILYPKKNRECVFINGKLNKIGEEKSFVLNKILKIGEEQFFVFCAETGENYLVPTIFYEEYNFQIGQCVKGWIDKINCTGRIFIEPNHPKYRIGEVYEFELLHAKFSNEKAEDKSVIYIIRDILGKEWEVRSEIRMSMLPSSLNCRVDKIKKGQLFLTVIS